MNVESCLAAAIFLYHTFANLGEQRECSSETCLCFQAHQVFGQLQHLVSASYQRLSPALIAPNGAGVLPKSLREGRERNKAKFKRLKEGVLGSPQRRFEEICKDLRVTYSPGFFLDAPFTLPDRFLQVCIPSVDYPRTDAPDSVHFAGGLPKGHRDAFRNPPSGWCDIIKNKSQKIVPVLQGSIATNFLDLVIPTMTGLEKCQVIFVVVAHGRKGASLPTNTTVTANARVADFVPFDEILPHCSAFITNGGYGAFQHAISTGTSVIVGGATEDKLEVSARAEWCGIGINLRTATPSPEAVLTSVLEILSNPKYKMRAMELEKEANTFDPMSIITQTIENLVATKP